MPGCMDCMFGAVMARWIGTVVFLSILGSQNQHPDTSVETKLDWGRVLEAETH